MKDREKLIELMCEYELGNNSVLCDSCGGKAIEDVSKELADHLIANGVFVSKPCDAMPSKDWKFTNADRIRAMTDEELAMFICGRLDCYGSDCPGKQFCHPGNNGLVEWMKKPAEVDNG